MDQDPFDDSEDRTLAARAGQFLLAVPFGLLSVWLFWLVGEIVKGNSWWDIGVRFVVGDFALLIALFALTLFARAVFPGQFLTRLLNSALKRLVLATLLLGLLFMAGFFVTAIIGLLRM